MRTIQISIVVGLLLNGVSQTAFAYTQAQNFVLDGLGAATSISQRCRNWKIRDEQMANAMAKVGLDGRALHSDRLRSAYKKMNENYYDHKQEFCQKVCVRTAAWCAFLKRK